MDIGAITPAALLSLAEERRRFLPSRSSIPGFHPSEGLWSTEAPLCKGRCSVWDPQELADVSPLGANVDHLGFADQISMGWDVHRWD